MIPTSESTASVHLDQIHEDHNVNRSLSDLNSRRSKFNVWCTYTEMSSLSDPPNFRDHGLVICNELNDMHGPRTDATWHVTLGLIRCSFHFQPCSKYSVTRQRRYLYFVHWFNAICASRTLFALLCLRTSINPESGYTKQQTIAEDRLHHHPALTFI